MRMPWKCLMFSMFSDISRSKAMFIMWLQMQAKLLTKERFLKWGAKVEPQCLLCQNGDKTRDHLFVNCSYTKSLQVGLATWMQMSYDIGGDWQQHLFWVLKNAKGKTTRAQSFRMVYVELIYAIQIDRY